MFCGITILQTTNWIDRLASSEKARRFNLLSDSINQDACASLTYSVIRSWTAECAPKKELAAVACGRFWRHGVAVLNGLNYSLILVGKVKTYYFTHLSDIWGILSPSGYRPINNLPKFRNRFYDIVYKFHIQFLCGMMIVIISATPSPSFIPSLRLWPVILLSSPLFPFFPFVTGNVKVKVVTLYHTTKIHERAVF